MQCGDWTWTSPTGCAWSRWPIGSYNVAIVALDEGPRMVTNILGGLPEADLRVGQLVMAEIDAAGEAPLCRFRSIREHPQ